MDRRTLLKLLPAAAALPARAGAGQPKPAAARDLTGVWTNAWYTHLERPKAFKGLVVSPADAEAYERPRRAHAGELLDKVHDAVGQGESEYPDNGPGLARIGGQIRSSWIVDPPDGKVPWKPGVKKMLRMDEDDLTDNPEDLDPDDRCITREGGAAPLLNSHDANMTTIVQGGGSLLIWGEKQHETQIVRIVASAAEAAAADPLAAGLTQPDGTAVGWWEGATLVVLNTGLSGRTKVNDDLWLSGRGVVTERFTRSGPDALLYSFEVDDLEYFTKVWKAEAVFRRSTQQEYEYACHEGNYFVRDVLQAARRAEAATPKPAS